jgi:hypothetical protein
MATAQTNIGGLQTGQTSLNSQMATAQTNIGGLQTGQILLNSQMATVTVDLDTLQSKDTDTDIRLTSTETDISGMRTDLNRVVPEACLANGQKIQNQVDAIQGHTIWLSVLTVLVGLNSLGLLYLLFGKPSAHRTNPENLSTLNIPSATVFNDPGARPDENSWWLRAAEATNPLKTSEGGL